MSEVKTLNRQSFEALQASAEADLKLAQGRPSVLICAGI